MKTHTSPSPSELLNMTLCPWKAFNSQEAHHVWLYCGSLGQPRRRQFIRICCPRKRALAANFVCYLHCLINRRQYQFARLPRPSSYSALLSCRVEWGLLHLPCLPPQSQKLSIKTSAKVRLNHQFRIRHPTKKKKACKQLTLAPNTPTSYSPETPPQSAIHMS